MELEMYDKLPEKRVCVFLQCTSGHTSKINFLQDCFWRKEIGMISIRDATHFWKPLVAIVVALEQFPMRYVLKFFCRAIENIEDILSQIRNQPDNTVEGNLYCSVLSLS